MLATILLYSWMGHLYIAMFALPLMTVGLFRIVKRTPA